ncbi:MAG: tRNA uridine-5-carboxymethylaminomethyl(34) synthesis GTPase MnmE [Nisaea sp.]|uniref:tRNA uridine-5-carboxymethylaminomethyl(34) synthesis GTPase MnmE n=1 Tax=Nisaea sp. TaxID=2024842 RepID=UPI001B2F8412|nr:tRNA uridine-5-carboxymethylaminomethyl(34) synthesis GTPase MnmE [Nisaea sp.]MBO6561694.1 tRNA uridine-5-carboxymethylaminomethyl(34) synthesis GTPase MnmE [Nisaea sp.]
MNGSPDDTIYALASAAGRAGVAVFRVSGPGAFDGLQRLTGLVGIEPRYAVRATVRDGDEIVDDGLVLAFAAPASFTGEDIVEYQLHGGRAVETAMLRVLGQQPGYRIAEPGEFSRRAVLNGKMDLTAAEGIADLVDAETDAQRVQARRQSRGALGALYADWRAQIVKILAYIEALVDFPDEDLPEEVWQQIRGQMDALETGIAAHLDDGGRGERLRDGLRMAIVGPPNAGKSSLLNWLSRRDAAIVSDVAGTTRDVIEVHLDIKGFPVLVADTAGLRESMDSVETEGIRRARAWAASADLVLDLRDAAEEALPAETGEGRERILVATKADQLSVEARTQLPADRIAISVKTGEGLDALLSRIGEVAAELMDIGEAPALTRARHREGLSECLEHLRRAAALAAFEAGEEEVEYGLVAEDLRLAARALGRVTGAVDIEEILDLVFSEFCIGK